jgi:hypothetical protein
MTAAAAGARPAAGRNGLDGIGPFSDAFSDFAVGQDVAMTDQHDHLDDADPKLAN